MPMQVSHLYYAVLMSESVVIRVYFTRVENVGRVYVSYPGSIVVCLDLYTRHPCMAVYPCMAVEIYHVSRAS